MVCYGSSCSITFENCVFELHPRGDALGALRTPHAPLQGHAPLSHSSLSVCAVDSGTSVVIRGGGIKGGMQGVLVHHGAHVEASDLTISEILEVGV